VVNARKDLINQWNEVICRDLTQTFFQQIVDQILGFCTMTVLEPKANELEDVLGVI
jgi:hypothetical protein